MSAGARRRGEPLLVLVAIIGSWVGLRVAFWEPPYRPPAAQLSGAPATPSPPALATQLHAGGSTPQVQGATGTATTPLAPGSSPAFTGARIWSVPQAPVENLAPRPDEGPVPTEPAGPAPMPSSALAPAAFAPTAFASNEPAAGGGSPSAPSVAAAHQLLWMAAVSSLPSPWLVARNSQGDAPASLPRQISPDMRRALVAMFGPSAVPAVGHATARLTPQMREALIAMFGPSAAPARDEGNGKGKDRDRATARARRWSGDAWLLLRSGTDLASSGAALPTYGASQMGAVLRYRLDPGGDHKLNLYLRTTTALIAVPGSVREQDAAFGVSARPVPAVPILLAVEGRISRFDDGSLHLRPAAMAITELPPMPLPLGLRADLYAAGGYVGGAAATAFADGQMHLDHALVNLGPAHLRLGAGVWGGAQQGIARLDVGPSASLAIAGGHTGARLSVDWRFRVAGTAAPASGPAVTLAAGF